MSERISEELISAYLDGELSSEEMLEVQAWLAGDSSAAAEANAILANLRQVQQRMRNLPSLSLPKNFADKVLAQLPPSSTATPANSSATPVRPQFAAEDSNDSSSNPKTELAPRHTTSGSWLRWTMVVASLSAAVFLALYLPNVGGYLPRMAVTSLNERSDDSASVAFDGTADEEAAGLDKSTLEESTLEESTSRRVEQDDAQSAADAPSRQDPVETPGGLIAGLDLDEEADDRAIPENGTESLAPKTMKVGPLDSKLADNELRFRTGGETFENSKPNRARPGPGVGPMTQFKGGDLAQVSQELEVVQVQMTKDDFRQNKFEKSLASNNIQLAAPQLMPPRQQQINRMRGRSNPGQELEVNQLASDEIDEDRFEVAKETIELEKVRLFLVEATEQELSNLMSELSSNTRMQRAQLGQPLAEFKAEDQAGQSLPDSEPSQQVPYPVYRGFVSNAQEVFPLTMDQIGHDWFYRFKHLNKESYEEDLARKNNSEQEAGRLGASKDEFAGKGDPEKRDNRTVGKGGPSEHKMGRTQLGHADSSDESVAGETGASGETVVEKSQGGSSNPPIANVPVGGGGGAGGLGGNAGGGNTDGEIIGAPDIRATNLVQTLPPIESGAQQSSSETELLNVYFGLDPLSQNRRRILFVLEAIDQPALPTPPAPANSGDGG